MALAEIGARPRRWATEIGHFDVKQAALGQEAVGEPERLPRVKAVLQHVRERDQIEGRGGKGGRGEWPGHDLDAALFDGKLAKMRIEFQPGHDGAFGPGERKQGAFGAADIKMAATGL